MFSRILSIVFLFAQFSFCIHSIRCEEGELIDLEEGVQDFVLDNQKIEIPGYPHAFNPSIVRWREGLLMCFRLVDLRIRSSRLGFIWLDENFSPISDPIILIIDQQAFPWLKNIEDARLIADGERLYSAFNIGARLDNMSRSNHRMMLAEIEYDGSQFSLKSVEKLLSFDGHVDRHAEKNWAPFIFNNQVLFSYTLSPHRVFCPTYHNHHCETLVTTQAQIDWKWGDLRGGTPSLLVDGQYLGFFHTCLKMASLHSQGKSIPHYFIGAYTFSNTPPFALTQISSCPIIGKNFYHGAEYKPYWRPVRVVFPGGFLFNDQYIWMVYGRQDHEIWIAKMDKQALFQSLVPVN